MRSKSEDLYRKIRRFTNDSPEGLLQLLVAIATRDTFRRIIECPTYPVPMSVHGLSTAVGNFYDIVRARGTHLPTFFAKLYGPTRTLEHRKRTGQFFTSQAVAKWALSRSKPLPNENFCDAGAGTGVFGNALIDSGVAVGSYIAIENDPILALCAAHVLELINAPATHRVWYANFLRLDERVFKSRGLNPPNVVIANPPFVRSRYLAGLDRVRQELKSSLGLLPSSLSGSGSYFLTRAAELAESSQSENVGRRPRLLFFLPREYAGAAHAHKLRHDLSTRRWTYREYEIPYDQTGIDRHPSNALALFCVFERENVARPQLSRQSDKGLQVKDVLRIRRGISTGCNDFFVLTDQEARRRGLNKWLKRVLPTRIHLPESVFTDDYWEELRKKGYPCWLLVLPERKLKEFDTSVQEYLREGLRRGLHATPTANTMRTWFSLPVTEPPDLFVTYFFRGAPRFILNSANAYNLTNILGGRFISPVQDDQTKELMICSLNKQAERWMRGKGAGREYKGGLRKIEPRELSQLPVDTALWDLVHMQKRAAKATTGSLFE